MDDRNAVCPPKPLRARHERPRNRAAEQRDELAALTRSPRQRVAEETKAPQA